MEQYIKSDLHYHTEMNDTDGQFFPKQDRDAAFFSWICIIHNFITKSAHVRIQSWCQRDPYHTLPRNEQL